MSCGEALCIKSDLFKRRIRYSGARDPRYLIRSANIAGAFKFCGYPLLIKPRHFSVAGDGGAPDLITLVLVQG